jgi:hypothetical protein
MHYRRRKNTGDAILYGLDAEVVVKQAHGKEPTQPWAR